MEILVEKEKFLKSLSKIQGVVEKRNTMPILSNTLIQSKDQELEIVATDLDITIIDHVESDIKDGGSITVNARKLYEIIRELPEGKISIKKKGEARVEVKAERSVFNLVGISSDEFPSISDISQYSFIEVEAKTIMDMIEKTIYASAGEEARFNLNGIFIEKIEKDSALRMVATDGHRLALIDRDVQNLKSLSLKKGVIMPRKGMSELKKLLEGKEGNVELAIKENNAAARINGTVLIMRLIDGDFPEYQRVVPEGNDIKAKFNRGDLLKTIRLASILADEKIRVVKFLFSGKRLLIEGKSANLGEARGECEMEYNGTDMEVGFNDRYIVDIINVVEGSENIVMEMKDSLSPIIVRVDKDPKYTCFVMPIRL
jgi:DNA polymerase-3 subunit beta